MLDVHRFNFTTKRDSRCVVFAAPPLMDPCDFRRIVVQLFLRLIIKDSSASLSKKHTSSMPAVI